MVIHSGKLDISKFIKKNEDNIIPVKKNKKNRLNDFDQSNNINNNLYPDFQNEGLN